MFGHHRCNIRDIFEFHGGETDPGRVKDLLCRGRTDLKTLQMLSQWSSETWNFGVWESAPDSAVQKTERAQYRELAGPAPHSLLMNIINRSL